MAVKRAKFQEASKPASGKSCLKLTTASATSIKKSIGNNFKTLSFIGCSHRIITWLAKVLEIDKTIAVVKKTTGNIEI
jgi:hypothetical protein